MKVVQKHYKLFFLIGKVFAFFLPLDESKISTSCLSPLFLQKIEIKEIPMVSMLIRTLY